MPTQLGEFVSRTFRAPLAADVDRAAYSNALLKNEVQRLPQANRMQDLQIQQQDSAITQQQRENAAGVLANRFAAVASSPRPRDAARTFIGGAEFQTAGKLLGMPIEQFQVTDQDTDDLIRQQAQTWAQALGMKPATGAQPTDDMREYDKALAQGFKGTFVDYQTQMRRAGATSIDMTQKTPPPPQGMVYEPDSDPNNRLGYRLVPIPGARDPRTEAQQKAGLLSARMRELSADIVDTAPTIPTQMVASVAQRGGMTGGLANQALSPEQQKHFNAARGWLAGVLRQDTGATIQPFEIAEYYPTFFPVPGDSPQVIEQKRKLRAVTEQAISANGGMQQQPAAQGATDLSQMTDEQLLQIINGQ
jgi:hypothetical protein